MWPFKRGPKRDWRLTGQEEWRVTKGTGDWREETLMAEWVDLNSDEREWKPARKFGIRCTYIPRRMAWHGTGRKPTLPLPPKPTPPPNVPRPDVL